MDSEGHSVRQYGSTARSDGKLIEEEAQAASIELLQYILQMV